MKSPAIVFIAIAVIVIWFAQLVFKIGIMGIYFISRFFKNAPSEQTELSKDFDEIFSIVGVVGEIRSIDIFEKELEVIITESESNLSKLEPTESNLSELKPVTTKKPRKPRMTKAKMIELEYEKYCDREALMT